MVRSEPFEDILSVWPWLPHFRAIAETEHLPSAARLCSVGPSSLSRSLSLLERQLGRPLFERTGRSLRLNHDGTILRDAMRDAMRRVDDACAELRDDELRGPLHVASAGAGTTAMVAPAVLRLRREHPGIRARLVTHLSGDIAADLLRGALDVAFQEVPIQRSGLTTHNVGSLKRSVYCGPHHELFGVAGVDPATLEEQEFVAPPPLPDGTTPDGWPIERPRRIALTTDQLRVGLEICLEQPLLAVLPDALAEARSDNLWRLDAVPIPATPVYAAYRTVLGPRKSPAARLVELVQP